MATSIIAQLDQLIIVLLVLLRSLLMCFYKTKNDESLLSEHAFQSTISVYHSRVVWSQSASIEPNSRVWREWRMGREEYEHVKDQRRAGCCSQRRQSTSLVQSFHSTRLHDLPAGLHERSSLRTAHGTASPQLIFRLNSRFDAIRREEQDVVNHSCSRSREHELACRKICLREMRRRQDRAFLSCSHFR